jgi:hypothetical protein
MTLNLTHSKKLYLHAVAFALVCVGIYATDIQSIHAARIYSTGCEFQGNLADGVEASAYDFLVPGSSRAQIKNVLKRSGLSSCRTFISSNTGSDDTLTLTGELSTSGAPINGPLYFRFYFYMPSLPGGSSSIARIGTAAQRAVQTIWIRSDGRLELREQGGSSVIATSPSALATGTWHRIEWYYNNSGAGTATVRVNGSSVMGVNAFVGEGIEFFKWGIMETSEPQPTGDFYFDDIAVNDTTGAYQNSWPGDGAIVHLYPNGAGDNNSWQTSTGGSGSATNYLAVDEITPDNSTTYLRRSSTGTRTDDYNVDDYVSKSVPANAAISVVSVGVRGGSTSSTASSGRNVQVRLKSAPGATVVESSSNSNQLHTSSWVTNRVPLPRSYQLTSYTDPTTSEKWALSGTNSIDAMQIGARVQTTSVSTEVRISTLWALVEYAVPQPGGECESGASSGFQQPEGGPRTAVDAALFLITSLMPQEKGACEDGTIGLGLGADFFTAISQMCLGTNCRSTWWPTLIQPSSCQMEVRRVRGVTTSFGATLSTQLCDSKLTAASVAAGWVATGMDYCDGGLCDAASIASCVYTRMACSGGVTASVPTKSGPYAHPATAAQTGDGTDFTFTPQCNDGMDNDGAGGTDYPADVSCQGYWDDSE